MPVPSRRLAAAGVAAAVLIALPAAAFASGSTSSGKPGPSATASNSAQPSKSPAAANSSAVAMKAAARGSRAHDSGAAPSMVAALATQLGVSHSAAERAMNQIDALNGSNGIDPASPAFAAIAHQLGVTPARLAAALPAAKQAAGRSMGGH